MSDRNASPSSFGWDFQVNSAILLMLENIKEAKKVRVEGAIEDIEITLNDKNKIYAQAKAVIKPDDYSNVDNKLNKALESLSSAAKNGDGILFTYITNSANPFNNQKTMSFFTGRTHLGFDELPDIAQEKIKEIVQKRDYTNFDIHKIDIRVIPFYGDDLKNRYKEIQVCIDEFLSEINVDLFTVNREIMKIWQRNLFQNATQIDTNILVSKEEMIWPLIVLVVDTAAANDYKRDFDDDEIDVIEQKYRMIINQNTMSYEMISRVISDYIKAKKPSKQFVMEHWMDYQNIVSTLDCDDSIKEALIKIIIYRIVAKKQYIQKIKRGANL